MTMGLNPEGIRLKEGMPRYALTRPDANDLVAYLKKIAFDRDPGIDDDTVRIGVLLPPSGGPAVRAALTAFFATLNNKGGVYGRRVDLSFAESPATTLSTFLQRETVFALLSSYTAGSEKEVAALLATQNMPMVGAWTLLGDSRASRSTFYLDSGLRGQADALAAFALEKMKGDWQLELIESGGELSKVAAESIRA